MQSERFTLVWKTVVDREMFALQTIRVKIFALLNFRGFIRSAKYCNG